MISLKKIFRKLFKLFISLIIFVALVVGVYVIYLTSQYYRIEDQMNYTNNIKSSNDSLVQLNTEYTITTYNIGFGAYNHEFSFFMDSGEMLDGTKVSGTGSKAETKEVVIDNTEGAIETIQSLSPDFMFFQEVDEKATRSHKVNQYVKLSESFINHNSIYTSNFHSGFLFYPLLDPHGKVESGIVTMSNKKIENVVRYKLEIDESFPTKFFDLDRCFSVSYLPIEGSNKKLVLVNVHLSAYDKGGIYRSKQWKQLNDFFVEEVNKGNYIVCGGDFNHDISNVEGFSGFPTTQKKPEWVYTLSNQDLVQNLGLSFQTAVNAPTCRSTDMPYTKGVNYTVVIDGFITSSNVEVLVTTNIDVDFLYSDHNPVMMKFVLR